MFFIYVFSNVYNSAQLELMFGLVELEYRFRVVGGWLRANLVIEQNLISHILKEN